MKILKTFTVITLLAVLSGCIPSLHPLYTREDLIFEPSLVGKWQNEDKETWEFQKDGDKKYKLIVTDDGKKGEFEANLLKLKGIKNPEYKNVMFIDLYPERSIFKKSEMPEIYQAHLLPVHHFLLVTQIEPELKMYVLDYDWFDDYIKENPGAVEYEKLEDGGVLTADTKELQKFMVNLINNKVDAFEEMDAMKKITEKSAK